MAEFSLPDGTRVSACSLAERQIDNPHRDFGLYLEPAWLPEWPAVMIDWPDFGLPAYPDTAFQQIIESFDRARGGERIEVGCLGGRGRTGTVLACFAVLCGLDPEAAIEWVRSGYDRRAVETTEQEAWVGWFAGRVRESESKA